MQWNGGKRYSEHWVFMRIADAMFVGDNKACKRMPLGSPREYQRNLSRP